MVGVFQLPGPSQRVGVRRLDGCHNPDSDEDEGEMSVSGRNGVTELFSVFKPRR